MRELNINLSLDKIKEKLGIKEVDLSPVISSISTIEKAIKDKKFDKFNTTKIEKLLKDISDKKVDNKEVISAIDKLAKSLNRDDKDYTDKFDALIIKVGEIGLYKPGYNKYDPQIRNVVGETINPSTSEKQDEIISAIDNLEISIPDGLALETKQDSQIALQTTLLTLTQTLQELTARLAVLGSMANAGQPALRTIPIGSVTTAVTGTLTGVGTITNFGTGHPALEMAHDINNSTAILANINNVVVS